MYRNIYCSRFGKRHYFGACTYETLEDALKVGRLRSHTNRYIKTIKMAYGLPIHIDKKLRMEYIEYV